MPGIAPNVSVQRRLLGGAGALDHNRSHSLREVRMTDHGNAQIGVDSSFMRLAEGDNVHLIGRGTTLSA